MLAVNRVQQVYAVPTYPEQTGAQNLLLPSLVHTHRIDARRLAARAVATVHVGDPPVEACADTPLPRLPPPPVAVTVVMPARNAAATVGRAVRSVALQRGAPRFQLLFLDDGSTDGTAAALTAELASVARQGVAECISPLDVRIMRRPADGTHSAAAAGDALLREVGTPWFARIDADDTWDRWHLQRLCSGAAEAGGAAHVVGTQAVRATATHTRVLPLPCEPLHVYFSALFYCPVAHSGALVQTQTAVEAGGYTGVFSSSRVTLPPSNSAADAAADAAAAASDAAADTTDVVADAAAVAAADAADTAADAATASCGAAATNADSNAAADTAANAAADADRTSGTGGAASAKADEGVVAEDYGLWTRVLLRYPLSVSNVCDALTTLHRHGGNVRARVDGGVGGRKGDMALQSCYSRVCRTARPWPNAAPGRCGGR